MTMQNKDNPQTIKRTTKETKEAWGKQKANIETQKKH